MVNAAKDTLDFLIKLNRKYLKIDLSKLKPGDKLKDSEKEKIEEIYAKKVLSRPIQIDVGV